MSRGVSHTHVVYGRYYSLSKLLRVRKIAD